MRISLKTKQTALLILTFCIMSSLAKAQVGSIKVRVFDKARGEALIGANVIIAGTVNGAMTDLDGNATISDLKPGSYNVDVSYISYQKKTINNVEVKVNEVTKIEVGLEEKATILKEAVVEARAIRNSENALLTMQRQSTKVIDAVSSEQFELNGDNDAAAAVNRVVGVTVEGGKNVYVRGLGDRYSKATLNGAEVPSLDPDKNSVQMDLFPSNMIDNIIVYKTFSPELSAEFSGGLVDITTKDFPDELILSFSTSLGYNTQSTFNKNMLTHRGSSFDFLALGAKDRALPDAIGGLNQQNFPDAYLNNEAVDKVTKSFDNTDFVPSMAAPPLDHSFGFSVGNNKKVFGKPLGFVAGVTYSREFLYSDSTGRQQRWEGVNNQIPTLNSDLKFDYVDMLANDQVNIGALFNATMKLNKNNKIGINLMHNRAGDKESRLLRGEYLEDQDPTHLIIGESRVISYEQRAMNILQVRGDHFLPKSEIKMDWFSSYTASNMEQPDLKFFFSLLEIDTTSVAGDTSYKLNNTRIRPSRYFRSMNDAILDNKFNAAIPFSWQKDLKSTFKFGLGYTLKERSYRENRYEYFNLTRSNSFDGNIDALFTEGNLGLQENGELKGYLDNFTEKPNNFDAEEMVYAGYVMVETPLVRENIKLTTGLRFERTERSLTSFDPTSSGGFETNDILPALNFTYQFTEKQNIRLGYGRTLARPTFREFAPLVTFGFGGDNTLIGNPQLTRTLIDNLDLRYEIFPKPGEYIGASLFYKNFTDPIELVTNPEAGGSTLEFTYVNVGQGMLYGAELEARKNLDFIAKKLKNFKVAANVAIMKSAVALEEDEKKVVKTNFNYDDGTRPMFYQSPYVANGSLIYENEDKGLLTNVSYSVFGHRLIAFQTNLPPLLLEKPRPELNFSVQKKLGDHFIVKFRAKNLLNPAYEQYMEFNNEDYVFSSYKKSRAFSLGLTYNL